MTVYILCGVIILLSGVIALQIMIQHFERKDLYNRIMSRDLTEYKGEKKGHVITAHEAALRRWRQKDGGNTV